MTKDKKTLSQAIQERRATPSFDSSPIPSGDLRQILDAGLQAPSGYNMQPWRFIVVQSAEHKKKLRAASYNQGKVEEASAVIVACGDADGWRKDLDLMLELGRRGGMPESYAAQAESSVPNYLSSFSSGQMQAWLNKQVMLAKVHEALRLPLSYWVVGLLAIGHAKGPDKFYGGRFEIGHTVFGEEFGKPLK